MAGNDILSRIQVLLDADTANFSSGMQKAKGESKSTFESIRENANKMGAAVAAGATTALVALSAMAWETANHAAELEKYALRSNTTTQEFQKMAVGAQAYGVEQEKLSDMMKDFNEKLGELTTIGAGGGVDFFEQIAVKTEGSAAAAEKLILKMQKLSGPEALQLYVDKLEEAGVTQQQMSFYLESMASDMTDLIPLLINGGDGMQLYSDAAERAGMVMSDETIAQAMILKEQMYLLDLQMQGAKNQLMQAVIPAFVDIASAFFSGSEQGLQFTDVANGIADGLRWVAKVAIGAATSVQLVGKTIGGLAAAGAALASGDLAGAKAIGSAMLDDLSATALAAADRMDQVTKSTASTTAKQMAALRQVNQTTTGVNKGLGELTSKQDKAAKASSGHSKALREQNRILEEQKRIIFDYSSADDQKSLKLAEEIERLRTNGMAQYVPLAQARYDEEKKLAEMQFAWEVAEHRLTENQKLAYSYNIKEQEIKADAKLTKDQREAKLQSLREQFVIEERELKISQQKQLLEVRKNWMSAEDYARDYYALIREEILSSNEYSPDMKNVMIREANMNQGIAENQEREGVWDDYQGRFGNRDYYAEDQALLKNALDQKLITEQEYLTKRSMLQAEFGEGYLSSTADVLKSVLGEESSYYQAAFAMAQGMAAAKVALNAPETYSNVYNAVSGIPYVGPYIAPVVAAGAVAVQLAQAAMVGNVKLTGMAHDGIDNIPQEGTWLLDGGERVLNSKQNEDLTKYLANKQTTPAQQAAQNLQINNILDPSIVGDFMGTSSGTKTFMNFIKNNRSSIKAMIA
ncbi:hypothetical protein N5C10_02715 [Acinetobacter johnsonii]|uniref:Phage tail tape measure protein n=1 Tax=Acinetobacter johnsonii TaxID=40214 RepID=A0AA42MSJ5_ACIJO|nr:hypothetical protein [Acinetobacter johnsonii]MDH0968228.1 hypothetical protein [Acinetobacter johnsonii]